MSEDELSSICKGLCDRETSQQIKGYNNGQKYCRKCEKYVSIECARCYCCKNLTRLKPRYNREAESKARLFKK
jgi:viroplasmin and RNaseH domain-containing protein